MRNLTLLLPILVAAPAAAALSSPLGDPSQTTIEAYTTVSGANFKVHASIMALPGEPVPLFASWPGGSPFKLVATAFADPTGRCSAPYKPELMPDDFFLVLTAAVLHDGQILLSHSDVSFGVVSGCETSTSTSPSARTSRSRARPSGCSGPTWAS